MNRKIKIEVSSANSREKEAPPKIPFDHFGRFAGVASFWLGSKWAFIGAGLIIAVWAITGPVFRYSDTWQLVINTGTTIVTFLMVFLIQNTQNRDARAINLKLDELIRAIDNARNQMINIETLSDLELDLLHSQYEKLTAGRTPGRAANQTNHAHQASQSGPVSELETANADSIE
jgi:low affinity Fe/Cu permease